MSSIDQIDSFYQLSKQLSVKNAVLEKDGVLIVNPKESNKIDVAISAIIHGNEVAGIHVVNTILKSILNKDFELSKTVAFTLGNIEAFKAGCRFIETDLNRSYGLRKPKSKEQLRAKDLSEVFDRATVVLDLHQTIEDTAEPFFICSDTPENLQLCTHLDKDLLVITFREAMSHDGVTLNHYLKIKDKLGITVELGPMGFDESQISLGCKMVRKLIGVELESIKSIRFTNEQYCYDYFYRPKKGEQCRLVPGLKNLSSVNRGDHLGYSGEESILAEHQGRLIFPKYGKNASSSAELFGILKPVKAKG